MPTLSRLSEDKFIDDMKLPISDKQIAGRRRGVALILVIGALALATMLLLAMFTTTETEYKATRGFAAAQTAKQMSQFAVNIVQSQLKNAQSMTGGSGSTRLIHATQPGLVRVYNSTGTFQGAYKLFSSKRMYVAGGTATVEGNLFTHSDNVLPSQWNSPANSARWVDLNEPVVRPPLGVSGGAPKVYFPIIDPRAAYNYLGSQTPGPNDRTTQVEGFSYSSSTAAGTSVNVAGVVEVSGASDPSLLRLPMPVEWIYVLQDGTMGTLDGSNRFQPAGGNSASAVSVTNPIVARFAFWTDDESCKVNINTAGEPTFMGTPYYYHDRDRRWAHYPASTGEYQRYPGHPATVALSSILAPGLGLDPLMPPAGMTANDVVALKESIYGLVPKISEGGSMSGTRVFARDDVDTSTPVAQAISLATSRSERLFASVDEMLFREREFNSSTGRSLAEIDIPGGGGRKLFDQDTLERSRFFLTAHSRAPEFTIHGLPRIAMWPIADETLGENRRTNFDNLIALCANLKGKTSGADAINYSYIFRRAMANHQTQDVAGTAVGASQGLQRNAKLLDYLERQLTQLNYPRTPTTAGGGTGGNNTTFQAKYGVDNVRQIIIQMFDYIRSTNLYDGVLARDNDGMSASGKTGESRYLEKEKLDPQKLTYTSHRISPKASGSLGAPSDQKSVSGREDVVPGHGQVTPALWAKGGKQYMGFGRMFTISEVGFRVICTADGLNDAYAVNSNGRLTGGGSSQRILPQEENGYTRTNSQEYPGFTLLPPDGDARWYSNFPPLSGGNATAPPPDSIFDYYGVDVNTPNNPNHPARHPAFNPELWNHTLETNIPLQPDQKRVQAAIELETFVPSLGWTKFYPEYTIVIRGGYINNIKVRNYANQEVSFFDTAGNLPLKSDGNIYAVTNVHTVGGSASPSAVFGGRRSRVIGSMGSDPGYATPAGAHTALSNMNLTSNFVTIRRDQNMVITFPNEPMVIEIWDSHDILNPNKRAIQTLYVQMPGQLEVPTPNLGGLNGSDVRYQTSTDSQGRIVYTRSREGPQWWCYNWSGCVDRTQGRVNPVWRKGGPAATRFWASPVAEKTPSLRVHGRLDTNGDLFGSAPANAIAAGRSLTPPGPAVDVLRTMIPAYGDYRIIAARYRVDTNMWQKHPDWDATDPSTGNKLLTVHSYSRHSNDEPGNRNALGPSGAIDRSRQLVVNAPYDTGRQADLPNDAGTAAIANSYGDFDAGITSARDGAYINKPDEGNFYVGNITRGSLTRYFRAAYFTDTWKQAEDWRTGIYMTPNRMISSPVMFGSLPSNVWQAPATLQGSTGVGGAQYNPWQTLLFRAYAKNTPAAKTDHPGELNPRDHFLLDLFYMPVVEPYAISEPLSQAGKINLNYQIYPFTHIRRATALHALMKGEFMATIPTIDVNNAKRMKSVDGNFANDQYYNEVTDNKYWHRPIDPVQTLDQFDEKFNFREEPSGGQKGLFRAASQICEVYLVPKVALRGGDPVSSFPNMSPSTRRPLMDAFWENHSVTPENLKERAYSNIYSKLTTRSNTFRVHVRSQAIRKARSTDPAVFDPAKDAILSEYRGSTVVERYIDPNDSENALPDYASLADPLGALPLEAFYKFRVLENTRFAP